MATKQASPSSVPGGSPLTYTLRVTNTGSLTLTAAITDSLPAHISPGGSLSWQPVITAPGGVWTQQVVVTVETGYTGTLVNALYVTTDEGPLGAASATACAATCPVYLPIVLKQ